VAACIVLLVVELEYDNFTGFRINTEQKIRAACITGGGESFFARNQMKP
jgi:hypothetical protein